MTVLRSGSYIVNLFPGKYERHGIGTRLVQGCPLVVFFNCRRSLIDPGMTRKIG